MSENDPQIDIFDAAPPLQGEFFKFQVVGDKVQGTYIDYQEGLDGYNNEQAIYVLKDAEAKV